MHSDWPSKLLSVESVSLNVALTHEQWCGPAIYQGWSHFHPGHVCGLNLHLDDYMLGARVKATTYFLGSHLSHLWRWTWKAFWVFRGSSRILGVTVIGSWVWESVTLGVSHCQHPDRRIYYVQAEGAYLTHCCSQNPLPSLLQASSPSHSREEIQREKSKDPPAASEYLHTQHHSYPNPDWVPNPDC